MKNNVKRFVVMVVCALLAALTTSESFRGAFVAAIFVILSNWED